jgi:hypothetical protein
MVKSWPTSPVSVSPVPTDKEWEPSPTPAPVQEGDPPYENDRARASSPPPLRTPDHSSAPRQRLRCRLEHLVREDWPQKYLIHVEYEDPNKRATRHRVPRTTFGFYTTQLSTEQDESPEWLECYFRALSYVFFGDDRYWVDVRYEHLSHYWIDAIAVGHSFHQDFPLPETYDQVDRLGLRHIRAEAHLFRDLGNREGFTDLPELVGVKALCEITALLYRVSIVLFSFVQYPRGGNLNVDYGKDEESNGQVTFRPRVYLFGPRNREQIFLGICFDERQGDIVQPMYPDVARPEEFRWPGFDVPPDEESRFIPFSPTSEPARRRGEGCSVPRPFIRLRPRKPFQPESRVYTERNFRPHKGPDMPTPAEAAKRKPNPLKRKKFTGVS